MDSRLRGNDENAKKDETRSLTLALSQRERGQECTSPKGRGEKSRTPNTETRPMPPEQTIRIIRSQDLTLRATLAQPRDMTGWAITFQVRDSLGGTSRISKTVGSGITITDAGKGIIEVSLANREIDRILHRRHHFEDAADPARLHLLQAICKHVVRRRWCSEAW